jgi:hypothetical protein
LSQTRHLPPGGGVLLVNSTTPSPRSRDQNVPARAAALGRRAAAQTNVSAARFRTVERGS